MLFAAYYLQWHYSQGLLDLIGIVRNFLWFFYEFFSIPILLKTLFSPFHRLGEKYTHSLNIEKWFETFVVNLLMRIVGMVLRVFLIMLGSVCMIITSVVGIFFLCAWMFAPVLLSFLLLFGIKLISVG